MANDGLFLRNAPILDAGYINDIQQFDPDKLKELFIALTEAFLESNSAVNQKDTGMYQLLEFITGQQFFPNPALSSTTTQPPVLRQTIRKVFNIGALPNAGTKTVAHGIAVDGNTTFTRIYGTASDVGVTKEYIPLPFVSVSGAVVAGNIELRLDDINIYITTTGNGTNFTVCYVVVEFLVQ